MTVILNMFFYNLFAFCGIRKVLSISQSAPQIL